MKELSVTTLRRYNVALNCLSLRCNSLHSATNSDIKRNVLIKGRRVSRRQAFDWLQSFVSWIRVPLIPQHVIPFLLSCALKPQRIKSASVATQTKETCRRAKVQRMKISIFCFPKITPTRSSNVLLMFVDSHAPCLESSCKLFQNKENYNFRVRCICTQQFIFVCVRVSMKIA